MKRILIITTNAIGDTYLSLSALQPIRNKWKDARITLVTSIQSQSMAESFPVDEYCYIQSHSVRDVLKMLVKVRSTKYDVAFSFFPGLVNSIVFFTSQATMKSGFVNILRRVNWAAKSQTAYYNGTFLENRLWQPTTNYLERVKIALLGAEIYDNVVKLRITEIEAEKKENTFVLHVLSQYKDRSLSPNSLKSLIEYLRHDKNKIIVIGSQKDMKSLLWLHDIYPKVEINLSPPFHELVSIISTCSMFIGVDSYPLHIADAYNTNFVGIFGPTNPHSVLVNDKKNIRFEVKSLQSIDSEILVNRIDAFIKETISF